MIVVVDNYDSFVHNLARYIRLAGKETQIIRNDEMSVEQVMSMNPSGIVISPGPCGPDEAGISVPLIKAAYKTIPILGVCLGHQCIGAAFGARVERAKRPMHGLSSTVTHDGNGLFNNLPNPLIVGRYHSLIVNSPDACMLRVNATSEEGEIMALSHCDYPVHGVQFHPESILTEHGDLLIKNFMAVCHE